MTPQRAIRHARLQEELNDALHTALGRIHRRAHPNSPHGHYISNDAVMYTLTLYDGVRDPEEITFSIEIKDYNHGDSHVGYCSFTLAEVFAELDAQ